MQATDEQIRLLAEIGVMAGGQGLFDEANAIASGLEQLRPESERPFILRAVALLNAGRTDEAIDVLQRDALGRRPDSSIAKAFLGLALHLAGRSGERDRVLQTVIDAGDDAEATALSEALLGSV